MTNGQTPPSCHYVWYTSILRTSRELSGQALGFLYSRNTFVSVYHTSFFFQLCVPLASVPRATCNDVSKFKHHAISALFKCGSEQEMTGHFGSSGPDLYLLQDMSEVMEIHRLLIQVMPSRYIYVFSKPGVIPLQFAQGNNKSGARTIMRLHTPENRPDLNEMEGRARQRKLLSPFLSAVSSCSEEFIVLEKSTQISRKMLEAPRG